MGLIPLPGTGQCVGMNGKGDVEVRGSANQFLRHIRGAFCLVVERQDERAA